MQAFDPAARWNETLRALRIGGMGAKVDTQIRHGCRHITPTESVTGPGARREVRVEGGGANELIAVLVEMGSVDRCQGPA
jgi:hypothetical protein